MTLKLNGSTAGSVSIDAPADTSPTGTDVTLTLPTSAGSAHQVLKNSATAGTLEYGLTLPSGNGTSGQYLQTDGVGGSSWQTVTAGTTWTTQQEDATGSTGLLLSSIPPSVEQVIIAYSNLSVSTTGSVRIQIGDSGGLETSGYNMFRGFFGTSTGGGAATTSFWGMENYTVASNSYTGTVFITRRSNTGWTVMWNQSETTSDTVGVCVGEKSLSDVLTQVQLYPSAGTFDNGDVRFKYLS